MRYVLDTEDPDGIERFRAALTGMAGYLDAADRWRRAIEAATLPPEPTDPGVRVRDREGDLWARREADWACWSKSAGKWVNMAFGMSWGELQKSYGPLEIIPPPATETAARPAEVVIETTEELDALPEGSVVLTQHTRKPILRREGRWWFGTTHVEADYWLPARLIYTPPAGGES